MPAVQPSYVNRDYAGLVAELTAVIQRTRPDLLSDFSDASLGALLRDLLAYVGDSANYAIDSAALEAFLYTCRRLDSGRMHAKSLGYVLRAASAAQCVLQPDSLPAEIVQNGGTIPSGSFIRVSKSLIFEAVDDIIIPANSTTVRITLTEGKSYDETLPVLVGASPTYKVSNANVAAGSWRVSVNGVQWTEVENLGLAGNTDTVYSVDFDEVGRLLITFGDGINGQVPNAPVRVRYRTCSGASGNLPARSVRGNLPIVYTPSGGSSTTVNVIFENYVVESQAVGELVQVLNENLVANGTSNTHTLSIPRFPIQPSTAVLEVAGPAGGILRLADDGAGNVYVVNNTTGTVDYYLGTISYSTGLVNLTYKRNATGTANRVGNAVSSVALSNGGDGYPNTGTVTFTGGGGTGATGTYTAINGVIQSPITITSGGSGYTSDPTPVFSGSGSDTQRFPTAPATYNLSYYYYPPAASRTISTLGAAVGGVDRENLTELKRNVLNYLRTSNRMVSYKDYRQGLLRVPGVALAHAERFREVLTGNLTSVYAWGLEQATLRTRSDDGTTASATYNRFAVVTPNIVRGIQEELKQRAMLSVQHVIRQPGIVWIDAYLGDVVYDASFNAATVRENIAKAAVAYFQSAGGFEMRLSNFQTAILSADGVRYVTLPRIAIGYGSSNGLPEDVAATAGSTVQNFTINRADASSSDYFISPGSVTLTFEQPSQTYVLVDDAEGNLLLSRGSIVLTAGTINYVTRQVNVTFGTALQADYRILAQFDDIAEDLRLKQAVTVGDGNNGDVWPPPAVSQSDPVVTPPFKDGKPLTKNFLPYAGTAVAGDVLGYAPLRDILLAPVFSQGAYYDNSYFYNDAINYVSAGVATDVVKAVNLRNLTFNLLST